MLESATIRTCYERAKQQLLDQRVPQGHWVGELSTSALSTATAVSALALATRHSSEETADGDRRLIARGVAYLLDHQNADGGWGDTELSHSNIATTMLCVAALTLTGDAEKYPSVLGPARDYITLQGGIPGLRRRYGKDKTFAVPILTNYALAGLVPWRQVAPLPFELAVLPQKFYKFVKLPVVSYAIPALVAIGQAKFYHAPPWNPITRVVRSLARGKSLTVLDRMQPESGGYLEAVPLTSFVVMSLASIDQADYPVVQEGLRFIRDSVRADGSWPIDTNLATWNTTLSLNALDAAGDDVGEHEILDWLLSCQFREIHPFTGADPGGWGWTDLPGSVPDADDTPGALLALAAYDQSPSLKAGQRAKIRPAAELGVEWLLNLQNSDGGWPTFCKGWGTQPFDRSGCDLTAHAIRALHRWHAIQPNRRTPAAIERGFTYLTRQQQPSGAWLPLWFGNQDQEREENPIYGTAKVLLAYAETGNGANPAATKAWRFLAAQQNPDGGFGGGESVALRRNSAELSGIEETALALECLAVCPEFAEEDSVYGEVIDRAAQFLCRQVEANSHRETSPIGFYFSKLWYYETLYPQVFTVAALGRLARRLEETERSRRESVYAESKI